MTRRIDRPTEGLYRRKLVKGGPWVPVVIWRPPAIDPDTGEQLERSTMLTAWEDGRNVDPFQIWPYLHPISEAEYWRLRDRIDDDPEAEPRNVIDLNTKRSLF